MRYVCCLLILFLLINAAWAADDDAPRSETLPKPVLLGQWADAVLPSLHTTLTARAAHLHHAARQACPGPNLASLHHVRQAWRETARAWAAVGR